MVGPRVTIDGLWRCLCPSFDAITLTEASIYLSPAAAASQLRTQSRTQSRRWPSPRSERHRTSSSAAPTCLLARQQHPQPPPSRPARRFYSFNGSTTTAPAPTPATPAPTASSTGSVSVKASQTGTKPNSLPRKKRTGLRIRKMVDKTPDDRLADPRHPNYNWAISQFSSSSEEKTPDFPLLGQRTFIPDLYTQGRPDVEPPTQEPPQQPTQEDELSSLEQTEDEETRLVPEWLDDGPKPPSEYIPWLKRNYDRNGSALAVKRIMLALDKFKVDTDWRHYHYALRVLAIHPDYVLRQKILLEMAEKWQQVQPHGHSSIAIGLLRDGQYEMALDKLEDMIKSETSVPFWVYEIFIYTFTQLGFFDEVFKIISHRLDPLRGGAALRGDPDGNNWSPEDDDDQPSWGHDVSPSLWSFVLDACSRSMYHAGTKYVWNRVVENGDGVVNPPDGVVLNVLTSASHAGDTVLATQAVTLLANRGLRLGLDHYEPLVTCHVNVDDLESAVRVLCIMSRAGVEPDAGTTRPIFRKLRYADAARAYVASSMLLDLKKTEGASGLPIAALNVVLEALVFHGETSRALDMYKHCRFICPSGPDLTTFKVLLAKGCTPEVAQFLNSEMLTLKIQADAQYYNLQIRLHVEAPSSAPSSDRSNSDGGGDRNLEVAIGYMRAMARSLKPDPDPERSNSSNNSWMHKGTALSLIDLCLRAENDAAWEVIEECGRRGVDVAREVERMLARVGREKGVKGMDPPAHSPSLAIRQVEVERRKKLRDAMPRGVEALAPTARAPSVFWNS